MKTKWPKIKQWVGGKLTSEEDMQIGKCLVAAKQNKTELAKTQITTHTHAYTLT